MHISSLAAMLLLCFTCLPNPGLLGQEDMPAAFAYHSEDYGELSTYPAACFEDAWIDGSGRLIAVTCLPEAADGMHLFSFDGYEFRVIRYPLDSLPADSKILAHDNASVVAGRSGSGAAFIANLLTGEIQHVALPDASSSPVLFMHTADTVMIAAATDNAIALTTWTRGDVSTTYYEYPVPVRAIPPVIWISRSALWAVDHETSDVYRIHLASRDVDRFVLDPAVARAAHGQKLHFRPYWVDGLPYIRTRINDSYVLLKPDAARGVCLPVEQVSGQIEECGVFEDRAGNVLLYFQEAGQPGSAILHLKGGGYIDYSPVFADYENTRIRSILGDDFTKSLLVPHTRGLRTHLIAGAEVIQQTLKGQQIRAMIELGEDQVLVTTQRNQRFLVDINEWDDPRSLELACHFGSRNLIALGGGSIAVTSGSGLLEVDPMTDLCNTLVSEVGAVSLAKRHGDVIWMINADGNLFEYHIGDGTVRLVGSRTEPIVIQPRYYDMVYSGGSLWVATSSGLWKVDPQTGSSSVIGRGAPFTDYHFLCIYADGKDRLWLGSTLGGIQVFDPRTGDVSVLDVHTGLPNNTVVSIQADLSGDIWAATHDGVALVNRDDRVVRVFDELDGLADNESNRYAGLTTSSGRILIGSINGLSLIDPEKVRRNAEIRRQPRIYLTDLQYRQGDHAPVHVTSFGALASVRQITLPARNRTLKARFALSDYVLAAQHTYEWKFASQAGWRSLGANILELDDIRPGKYVLQVRGADREGSLSSNVIQFGLHVQRFFYESVWFYLLCGLVAAGLVFAWILRLRWAVARSTATIRDDQRIIESQAQRLRELDAAKSRYFTEISHELRTPLTIISGMSAQILDEPDKWSRKGALMIRKNSQRLLKLVNQILDLRKLESSEIQFNMVRGNIVAYLSYLGDTFSDYTQTRDIDFSFVPYSDKIIMDYDPERIADIISNLVSNAIKYCQAGDQIQLVVDRKNDHCLISVIDTGTGISEEHLPHIFDRFYRVESDHKEVEGTGVGLALVSELVHRLKGKIDVESTPQEGSAFTVEIPIVRKSTVRHDIPDMTAFTNNANADIAEDQDQHPASVSVLVIEDHPDLLAYMKTILEGRYNVHFAQDGHIGETMAFELIPDLVISDVMMPGQTGLELCSKLKTDRRTDHIPVILLTAKADRDTKLESLQKGSDAFLTKPFDRDELLMVITNLLDQRRQLQTKYTGDSGSELAIKKDEPGEAFVAELNKVIDQHMENDEFSVVHLCRAMSMSRTNLHNKIKALTGRSTTGYIRLRRLTRAKELLKQGDLNVSEVAYAVGFKSQSYFSTTFAREFGVSPSASA